MPRPHVQQHTKTTDATAGRGPEPIHNGATVPVPIAGNVNRPEEGNINLQDLALQQLNLVDITTIADVDENIMIDDNNQPLTLVSDPFWTEFNQWRLNNPDAYDH